MRFDRSKGQPAAELVQSLDEKQLARIFFEYGEEKQARRIAKVIVRERDKQMIRTTRDLSEIILGTIKSFHQSKTLARIFQALRIAVNDELGQLARALPATLDLLTSGGRLAVISYHSLEDRAVKRFLQTESKGRCTCPDGLPVCACGSRPTMKVITRRGIVPQDTEIEQNQRARSARLRIGERL